MEHQILRKFNFSSRQNFAEQVWFPLRKCIPDRKSKEKSIFAHKGWFSPTARKIIPPVEAIMVARGLPAPTRHQLKMIKMEKIQRQGHREEEKHTSHIQLFGGKNYKIESIQWEIAFNPFAV